MAQIKYGDAHGLYRVQVGLVGDDGLNYGTAGSDMENGTTTSSYMIRYAKAAEMAMPDRSLIDFTGGDVWTGSYLHGITALGSFTLTLSTVDATLNSLVTEAKVDQTTNENWTIFSDNVLLPTPNQVWMATTFRIQSKEPGTKGANKFMHQIVPRCWLSPKGLSGAPNFQSAGENSYTIVPTVGEKIPHGVPFTTSVHNFEENETPLVYMITDYPIHFVAHKAGEGAESVINLPYTPIGQDSDYATPNSRQQRLQVAVNDVIVDANEVDISNRVVRVATNPGDYVGILYETDLRLPQ